MGIIRLHGKNTKIDDEMIPIVAELNRLGLHTISSCSGHPERGKRGQQAQLCFDCNDCDVLLSNGMISINWLRRE